MNVVSMFDGMSCLKLAADSIGLHIESYYASEIDKYAQQVSAHHFPEIVRIGDANGVQDWELPKIDLLTAGSPCQDLSRIKSKERKGLKGDKSSLFWKFVEALYKFQPKYFLLENVEMPKEDEQIITEVLGVEPITINSRLFTAQDRKRLYWTNIPLVSLPAECLTVLKDIIEPEVDEKYFYNDSYTFNGLDKRVVANMYRYYPNGKMKLTETLARVYNVNGKSPTLTAVAGGHQEKKIWDKTRIRKLTPLEYERLQGVPDNYTAMVSNSQRYKMLGNGWTVPVIAHILKGLKEGQHVTT